jgi:hypothetical protein
MRMIGDAKYAVSDHGGTSPGRPSRHRGPSPVSNSHAVWMNAPTHATRVKEPDLVDFANTLSRLSPTAVLSHRSAAQLWGLWIPRFGDIEVTTPACERGRRYTTGVQQRSLVAHRRITPDADITELHGIPVTTLARTWLDLAPFLGIHDLVAAGDAALRAGASAEVLTERVKELRHLRGTTRARLAVGLLNKRSRSRPESRIRVALVLGGLPAPRVNEAIYDEHGQWLAEPDLHYEEALLALEYNGSGHAEVKQMRKDSVRELDVQRARWKVLTFTAPHAFRRLDEVVSDVYQELRRRAPQLLTRALDKRRARIRSKARAREWRSSCDYRLSDGRPVRVTDRHDRRRRIYRLRSCGDVTRSRGTSPDRRIGIRGVGVFVRVRDGDLDRQELLRRGREHPQLRILHVQPRCGHERFQVREPPIGQHRADRLLVAAHDKRVQFRRAENAHRHVGG